jgi:hypothetical protein
MVGQTRWSDPENREKAIRTVKWLRSYGDSYEQICLHMYCSATKRYAAPWEVYEWANPSKTPAQVQAWKARHYPNE